MSEVLLSHIAEYSNVLLLNFPRTAQRGRGCPAFTQDFHSKLFVILEGSYKLGAVILLGKSPVAPSLYFYILTTLSSSVLLPSSLHSGQWHALLCSMKNVY